MALLPGIDSRNYGGTSPYPVPNRNTYNPYPGWSVSPQGLGPQNYRATKDGTRTFNPDNPEEAFDWGEGSPEPLKGPGNWPIDYNGETLYRNPGPLVGYDPNQGVLFYSPNGKVKVQPSQLTKDAVRANSWVNFDSLKAAQPGLITNVQQMLLESGLLSKGSFVAGRFDKNTQAALYVAMQEGNRSGQTWMQYAKQQANMSQSTKKNAWVPGSTYTQSSVSYTTKETAMMLIDQAIASELGRAPTKGETAKFLRDLRAEERDNPVITTTTRGKKPGNTSQVTDGGLDSQAYAALYAEDVRPNERQRYKEAQFENDVIEMLYDGIV